jgi:hypothetical protein
VAAEHPFMDLTMCSRVCFLQGDKPGNKVMRKAILGAASALALASPALAADLQYLAIAKFQAMSGKFIRTSTEMRPSLSRSQLPSFPRL